MKEPNPMSQFSHPVESVIGDVPIVLVARGVSPEQIVERCDIAWAAGITAIEVTIEKEDALPTLEAAVRHAHSNGKPMGAGTIRTTDQLEIALQIGADFLVAPGFSRLVAQAARGRGVPFIPGVATASEITAAVQAGCQWLKVFPASGLTPEWVRAQRGPFPDVHFIATGGVGVHNARAFLEAGCRAVGLGTSVNDADLARLAGALRGSQTHGGV